MTGRTFAPRAPSPREVSFDDDEQRFMELAKASAEVTHNDPEGIMGAQAAMIAAL